MKERQLQKAAFEYLTLALRRVNGFVTAIPGGDGRATRSAGYVSGTPDMLCVLNGRAVLIELKTAKGRVKPHQADCHKALERAGAVVHVARSLDEIEGIADALICGRAA